MGQYFALHYKPLKAMYIFHFVNTVHYGLKLRSMEDSTRIADGFLLPIKVLICGLIHRFNRNLETILNEESKPLPTII